jgi:ubiquinone/menaquinone biosynthesis C-methylase UbiE
MTLKDLHRGSDPTDWDHKWADIFDHYQRDLRHAHYVRALLAPAERTVLELAAGSFRDMAALRRMGVDCSGMDFSPESVSRAQAAFPEYAHCIHRMSAFEMPFADKAFDVTYHNGFWGLFSDEQVHALAAEQARITRHRMIATVHNLHNQHFAAYFGSMKLRDPLYDIRFYTIAEITEQMSRVCDNVSVIPVGKHKRRHEDMLIKAGLTQPGLIRTYLKLCGHRLIDRSERLLCIGTPK